MLQISTTQFGGKYFRVDLHGLPPIGTTRPHEMPPGELYRALKRMGVPRIAPDQGCQDLLLRYGVHLQEQAEAVEAERISKLTEQRTT